MPKIAESPAVRIAIARRMTAIRLGDTEGARRYRIEQLSAVIADYRTEIERLESEIEKLRTTD